MGLFLNNLKPSDDVTFWGTLREQFVQLGDRRDPYAKLFLCLINIFAPESDHESDPWSDKLLRIRSDSNKHEHFSFQRRFCRIFGHYTECKTICYNALQVKSDILSTHPGPETLCLRARASEMWRRTLVGKKPIGLRSSRRRIHRTRSSTNDNAWDVTS
jgi:hypothetical protein